MHTIILFFPRLSLSLCILLSPINLLFLLCLPQSVLPHHVCEHLTQHICSLPTGDTACWRVSILHSAEPSDQTSAVAPDQMSHSAVQKRSAATATAAAAATDGTGQTPLPYSEVAWARLHFTQPRWACLNDLFFFFFFTGISNQTAVGLWGQTEINGRHDPINVCIISKLNKWRIKTEWAIFVTCIFPLWKVLINWSNHVYKFMRDETQRRGEWNAAASCLVND